MRSATARALDKQQQIRAVGRSHRRAGRSWRGSCRFITWPPVRSRRRVRRGRGVKGIAFAGAAAVDVEGLERRGAHQHFGDAWITVRKRSRPESLLNSGQEGARSLQLCPA